MFEIKLLRSEKKKKELLLPLWHSIKFIKKEKQKFSKKEKIFCVLDLQRVTLPTTPTSINKQKSFKHKILTAVM